MDNVYQISQEFDDEPYSADYASESYGVDYDDEASSIGSFIDSGVNAVGRIIGGGVNNAFNTAQRVGSGIGQILGIAPAPAPVAGINHSPLSGKIRTQSGRDVSFQLPADIQRNTTVLSEAVKKLNTELKKVADISNNNGKALAKLSSQSNAAISKQNELIRVLGKTVKRLQKEQQASSQQAMLTMLLGSQSADTLTLKDPATAVETTYDVIDGDDDNNMLLMMMMMGGGGGFFGGKDDDDNDNSKSDPNPMMWMLMADAFK